jgi:hypothetical protein
MFPRPRLTAAAGLIWLSLFAVAAVAPGVETIFTRVPEGGLQPQVLVSSNGVTHLVYFAGTPGGGDLFYTRRISDSREFNTPIRVNTQPGCAIAIGTIRGAQIALGKNGRVHVAWNGSGEASGHRGAPMFYTRLNDERTAFEPQRDVMTFTGNLDGGGSVAADQEGNVYVAWHGTSPETEAKETERAVYLAVSKDEGRTFAREHQANPDPTGACGCCGLKAFADSQGTLYLLYRAATGGTERDEVLLSSLDQAKTFRSLSRQPWKSPTCPMSSAWLSSAGKNHCLAAWETKGHVWFTTIDPREGKVPEPIGPADSASGQKHPVAISGVNGETFLVWAEGTGWQKGGTVAWQLFDAEGKPKATAGRRDGIPVWSFATALARRDGSFEIIY